MTYQFIESPAPASERAAGPIPAGVGIRKVSSATGLLLAMAVANIVPALEVKNTFPARYASLLLGSVQAWTPGGSIGCQRGSAYVSRSHSRPAMACWRYGSSLRTTRWPDSSVSWPPDSMTMLRTTVSPSPERFAVIPQPH